MYEVCVSNLFGSNELCFTEFHMIFLLCFSKFHIIVLKAKQAARDSRYSKQDKYVEMRRRKDEEHEAKKRMLVSDIYCFLVGFLVYMCVYMCLCRCGIPG